MSPSTMRGAPPGDEADGSSSRVRRALEAATRLRSKVELRQYQRPLLIISGVGFAVATVVSFASLPDLEGGIRWGAVPAVVLLVPAGVWLNVAEYMWSARMLGIRIDPLSAWRVSVLASAGNMLPVPGSILVRTQALRDQGNTYRRAFAATALTGLAYLGAGFLCAGVFLVVDGRFGAGAALTGIGVASAAVTLAGARTYRTGRAAISATGMIMAIEVISVLLKAVMLFAVAALINAEVGLSQAVAISLSIVLSSAIAIVPGGLGVREGLAAVISPMVGVPASVGLVITAVARLIGTVLLAAMAGLLALLSRDSDPSGEAEPSSP